MFVTDIPFEKVDAAVRELVAGVEAGEYDADLQQAGMERTAWPSLSEGMVVGQGQGLTPDQWGQVIVDFAPVAAGVAKGVWTVVILPELKRRFRPDRVSGDNPNKGRK